MAFLEWMLLEEVGWMTVAGQVLERMLPAKVGLAVAGLGW